MPKYKKLFHFFALYILQDIGDLVSVLSSTYPHFIRCLKPNSIKAAGYVHPTVILHQLQYLGVLDSIRIRHTGFSFRKPLQEFYERFKVIVPSLESEYGDKPSEAVIHDCIMKMMV